MKGYILELFNICAHFCKLDIFQNKNLKVFLAFMSFVNGSNTGHVNIHQRIFYSIPVPALRLSDYGSLHRTLCVCARLHFLQFIYSPAPGGAPSERAEGPQLPGKSAKPLHTGQCCNRVLPRVTISQLCVPPAGP